MDTPTVILGKIGEVSLTVDSVEKKLPAALARKLGKTHGTVVSFRTASVGAPETYEVDGEVHTVNTEHPFALVALPSDFNLESLKEITVKFPSGDQGKLPLKVTEGRKLRNGEHIPAAEGSGTVKIGDRTWNVTAKVSPRASGEAARVTVTID